MRALRRGADLVDAGAALPTDTNDIPFIFVLRTYVRTYVRIFITYVRVFLSFSFLLFPKEQVWNVILPRLPTACRAKHSLCIGPCKCPLDNCATVCRAKHSLCIGQCKCPLAKMAYVRTYVRTYVYVLETPDPNTVALETPDPNHGCS